MDKHLYFFYNPLNNTIKIGRSDDIDQRLKSIKYMSGVRELRRILSFDYRGDLEPYLHNLFSRYRTIGEWFRYESVLKSYVEYLLKYEKNIEKEDLAYIAVTNDVGIHHFREKPITFRKIKRVIRPQYDSISQIYYQLLIEKDKNLEKSINSLWECIQKKHLRVGTHTIAPPKFLSIDDYFIEFNDNKYSLLTHYL